MYCKYCGAKLNDDDVFCKNCGKPVNDNNIAPSEGNMHSTETSAPVISENAPKKGSSNKKIIAAIVAAVIIVAGGGIGFYTYHEKSVQAAEAEAKAAALLAEQERLANIQEYIDKVIQIDSRIEASKSNFNLINSLYGPMLETYQTDALKSYFMNVAKDITSNETSTEKSRKQTIDKLYEELNDFNCDEPEIQDVKAALSDLYSAYEARYNLSVNMDFEYYNYATLDERTSKNFDTAIATFNEKFDLLKEEYVKEKDELEEEGVTNDLSEL